MDGNPKNPVQHKWDCGDGETQMFDYKNTLEQEHYVLCSV